MSWRNDPEFIREMDVLLDEIFDEAADIGLTWPELADAAGLAVSTVWRIGSRLTTAPHHRTVWRLARAVGFELILTKKSVRRRRAS